MLVPLTMEQLGKLDQGFAGKIIDRALSEAVRDLDDRDDGKPRVVNVKITLEKGERDDTLVTHVATSLTLPPRSTKGHVCKLKQQEGETKAFFQEFSPDDPNQRTFDEVERENSEQ